jgi:hypothetical protein
MHQQGGTDILKVLPWRAVVNPSVHVARHGFLGRSHVIERQGGMLMDADG